MTRILAIRFKSFRRQTSLLWAARIVVAGLYLLLAVRGSAAPTTLFGATSQSSVSLLTDVARLARDIPSREVARWRRLVQHPAHLSVERAARLHLWLGEIEIARNRDPERALEEFRQAQRLTHRTDPIYGCAAYDRAFTLFLHGAYALAAPAFQALLRPNGAPTGYNRASCALMYRRAAACAGYHAQHAKLGITEPPSLDPLCGVASLAACLEAHGRPHDRKTLLSHCRVTGLGNSMQDLLIGAQRLGMSAVSVKADQEGLKALPKPLVAYVEQDHFVAVTRADQSGVSYLCSDCGAWPGGRRDLTWQQWRAMDCNLYLAVTKPGSPEDQALRSLPRPTLLTPGAWRRSGASSSAPQPHGRSTQSSSGPHPALAAYHGSTPTWRGLWLSHLLASHILYESPTTFCGQQPQSPQCPPNTCCPADGGGGGGGSGGGGSGGGGGGGNGGDGGGGGGDGGGRQDHDRREGNQGGDGGGRGGRGPSAGDPVNLATGAEEYKPDPDLVVYNPIGPDVVWSRQYCNLRGQYSGGEAGSTPNSGLFPYAQYAFGYGWNSGYDWQVVVSGLQIVLFAPNGGGYQFNAPSIPTASNPQVACPAANAGIPMLCAWNYNSDGSLSVVVTRMDRSQWIFSSNNGYALSSLGDRNGNAINFVYTTPGANPGYELSAITDSNNQPLLTIHHNAHFNITSVSDRYHRSVYYKTQRFVSHGDVSYAPYEDEPVQVSQVVPTGTLSPPMRYLYGYQYITTPDSGQQFAMLHTLTVPSPTGRGVSTTTINYNGFFIGSVTDGNGNTRTYTAIDANDTQVTVTDPKNNVVYSYTINFDSMMRQVSRTDGTNQTIIFQAGYLPDNPYQPATVTNGNNETTTYTYDPYGTVTSKTSPRGVTTTYNLDYSVFPLGEVKQIQEGSKSPHTLTYYEPSGLVKSISLPQPGTSGSTAVSTVTTNYDSLGNVLTVQKPGNQAAATITTTLNYTQDGAYSQTEALNQPLTATDNLGHVTHFRYDTRGNKITTIDALGNRTDMRFNLANQLTSTFAPAIGDVTNLLGVARSSLTYSGATKTYNGTLTLTNIGSGNLQGYLLLTFTNLAPGVTLANASGTYVNSPALLSAQVSLAPGAKTVLNVSFAAPSANAVNYGVQTYLTDTSGTPLAMRSETRNLYLYPGGPLAAVNTYDETGALYRQVRYGYGKEGEQLSVSGSTEPVTYTYDAAYRRQTLADGNGNATTWAYNTAGWLASVTYPLGDSVQYPSYDPMGNVLKRIDGRGIETDYTYNDPESKLTNVAYVNNASYPNVGQYDVSIDYDGYGRLQDTYDFSGRTHLDYDDLDEKTEIDTTYTAANGSALPAVALTYGFNPDGTLLVMSLQTSTTSYDFTYGYDGVGRPNNLTNPFSERTQWSYLDNNWLASQQYANGVICQHAYNRRGFLNDLTHYASNGSLLSDFGAMVYDVAANRLTKMVTIPGASSAYSGTTGYAYDLKDQLTQEQSTLLGSYTESFVYDPAGNPQSFKATSHGFNADNQFTDAGFGYDGVGNPTSYAGAALSFDPEDHMTGCGSALTAGYGFDGLRAWKQNSSGRTYFIYAGITPVLEMDGSGNVVAVNTFGDNGLISRHTGSGSIFYACDPQGNTAERLDGSANLLSVSAFDAFGFGSSTSVPSDPFGYRAQWSYYSDAESGLQLLGHRYYDPGAGRFLTRDPISYAGGINLYAYATDRPVFAADPTGYYSLLQFCQDLEQLLCYIELTAAGGAAAGGAAAAAKSAQACGAIFGGAAADLRGNCHSFAQWACSPPADLPPSEPDPFPNFY